MNLISRLALVLGLLGLVVAASGCLSSLNPPLRCAPVAVVNGRHLALNRADYASVEPKLSSYLADRGMTLVSDLASADMLVAIAYEPDLSAPGKVNVLVLEIARNHLNGRPGASLDISDRDFSASRPAETSFPRGVSSTSSRP